jgi:glucuronoarabinoxylan endo-1,4-beta-xylanase
MKYLAFLSQEFVAVSHFFFAAGWETREGSAKQLKTRSSAQRKFFATTLAVAFFLFLSGPIDAQAQTATVNWTDVHQVIDGFGASNAFRSNSMSSSDQSFFFGTGSGQLGLSILRVMVPDGSGTVGDCSTVNTGCAGPTTGDMSAVLAQGGRIYASPWAPPGAYTTNGSSICTAGSGNGTLATGSYANYATWLANFAKSVQAQVGAYPYALSIQNEPDQCLGYDSALWTSAQIDTFVKDNLGPTFAADSLPTLIFIPENGSYSALTGSNGGNTCGTDTSCTSYVGGYNWHDYDAALSGTNTVTADPYPSGWATGKKYWETEASCLTNPAPNWCLSYPNTTIADALQWAAVIDQRIAGDNANAWLYWWLNGNGSDDQGLTISSGNPAKRAYMLGQYGKFARPGYSRIDATRAPQTGVSVSAYKDPSGTVLAIVATNYTGSAVSQTFNITNAPAFSSVTPTQTSTSLSLSTLSKVSVSDNSFTYTLPDQSITTFVGGTSAPSAPINLSATVAAQ